MKNIYPNKQLYIFFLLFFILALPINAQWIQTSGPISGTARSFYFDGTFLYAGTYGGVYRSSTNGGNWTIINNGLTAGYIYSLIKVGSNLYCGTESGVFISTNNGDNWTPAGAS